MSVKVNVHASPGLGNEWIFLSVGDKIYTETTENGLIVLIVEDEDEECVALFKEWRFAIKTDDDYDDGESAEEDAVVTSITARRGGVANLGYESSLTEVDELRRPIHIAG